jgi:hypothetical protein
MGIIKYGDMQNVILFLCFQCPSSTAHAIHMFCIPHKQILHETETTSSYISSDGNTNYPAPSQFHNWEKKLQLTLITLKLRLTLFCVSDYEATALKCCFSLAKRENLWPVIYRSMCHLSTNPSPLLSYPPLKAPLECPLFCVSSLTSSPPPCLWSPLSPPTPTPPGSQGIRPLADLLHPHSSKCLGHSRCGLSCWLVSLIIYSAFSLRMLSKETDNRITQKNLWKCYRLSRWTAA